jgi:hypothetical protein
MGFNNLMGKWQEEIKQIANLTEEYKEDLVRSLILIIFLFQ